ncbi:MAG: cohesin domain-containing protein [Patescibacteria group bacterium]
MQPSTSKVGVNNLFTLRILANTQDKYINNAEAVINFPNDLIEVVSVDSKSSIFGLWVEQPNFSNTNGTVGFNGGITNPGYKGSGGQLLSIVFKAKKSGTASLFFSGAAIRENDGLGTDIISGQNSANIVIDAAVETTQTIPPEQPTTPSDSTLLPKVVVGSPTHPDQNLWYTSNDAIFSWGNPYGVKTLAVLLDKQPGTIPTKIIPISEQRDVPNIDDGISFFHIRYRTNDGWSQTASYKVQIDSQPPYDLSIRAQNETDGTVNLYYNGKDDNSGINYFEIKINDNEPVRVSNTAGNVYQTSLAPGKYSVILTAVDKAGNHSEYKTTFDVTAVNAPQIVYFTPSVTFGHSIYARGKSAYPQAHVAITLKSAYGAVTDYEVESDRYGAFSFGSEPLNTTGDYELWASVLNVDSTKGPASEHVKIELARGSRIMNFVREKLLTCTGWILLLILLLALLAAIGWYKFLVLKLRYKTLVKHHRRVMATHESKVSTTHKSWLHKLFGIK